MALFANYKDDYERIWSSLAIRPEKLAEARRQAEKLQEGKAIYQRIESRTGVPWWFIGLCHYRESAFDFETYLGNGQTLARPTTIVPKGRGPFIGPDAFLDGAIDALRLEGFIGSNDWSIARVLFRLEGFNGYGYHAKQVASPYLWGGSTAYGPPESRGGKYVRDHVFDATVVDKQLGTAVILKAVLDLDSTISLSAMQRAAFNQSREPDEELETNVLWLQQSLNRLGTKPQLAEDGKNGPKTMGSVSAFQQTHGLDDTGLADAQTIAAIQQALTPALAPVSDSPLAVRIDALERLLSLLSGQIKGAEIIKPSTPLQPQEVSSDLRSLIVSFQQMMEGLTKQQSASGVTLDTLIKSLEPLRATLASKATPAVLGQVNGALGTTIGQLLNGKKTAIGIIGTVFTQILSQVPAATGLGQVLSLITPAAGLSPYTMPIFIALTVWGALGKFEKWNESLATISKS